MEILIFREKKVRVLNQKMTIELEDDCALLTLKQDLF
jgi:hypothetical protein